MLPNAVRHFAAIVHLTGHLRIWPGPAVPFVDCNGLPCLNQQSIPSMLSLVSTRLSSSHSSSLPNSASHSICRRPPVVGCGLEFVGLVVSFLM